MMNKTNLIILLPLVLLTGCTIAGKQDHKITWAETIHSKNVSQDIYFGPKRTTLEADEKQDLKELYESFRSDRITYARLYVEDHSLRNMSRKSYHRLQSLKTFLKSLGIDGRNIAIFSWPEIEFGESRPDTVIVMFENRQLMPNNCPGWKQSIDSYIPPEGENDFGCANAVNTARMIADRNTLIQGKELVSRDSSAKIRAVKEYQEGKVKEPRLAKPSSEQQGTR